MSKPPDVSWAWVLLGVPAGLLATYDPTGAGVWWAVSRTAGWVWRLPYVAPVVCVVAVLVVAGVAVRVWSRRIR